MSERLHAVHEDLQARVKAILEQQSDITNKQAEQDTALPPVYGS